MTTKRGFTTMLFVIVSIAGFSKADPNQDSAETVINKTSEKMLNIDWNIQFENADGKQYQLALLEECEVIKSVDNLTDVATIQLPELILNEPLKLENKIQRGAKVDIRFGYNGDLKTEFNGYVKNINVNDGSIKIQCEDALFLFRKGVRDKYFESTNIKQICEYLTQEVGENYKVECDYDITYEKFTIFQATAYDVLKKLKDETKANIFFDTKNKLLHIHQPYTHKTGDVKYCMQKNIENSNLEYVESTDKKFEVTVESTDKKGNLQSYTAGTTGGDKITLKVGSMDKNSIKELAETTLKEKQKAKYKGDFDTWLIPYCEPSYSAIIEDEDYPNKKGRYYIAGVTTSISRSGGKRTIKPSKRLS